MPDDTIPTRDAQAVIDTATRATKPQLLDPEDIYHLVVPEGAASTVLDLEKHMLEPRRRKGTVNVHTAASLIQYVQDQRTDDGRLRIFADVFARQIVGVLNGHQPADGTDTEAIIHAGWGDHRVVLSLRHTAEWEAWAKYDGELLAQTDFAEHIEDRLDDIVSPPAADVLELAKTFEANTNVEFASAIVLESGQRQLTYKETVDARAGQDGRITIPKEIELGIAPFEGTDRYKVVARLRYRISSGRLGIGYQLVRKEDTLRDAVDAVIGEIEAGTDLTSIRGTV